MNDVWLDSFISSSYQEIFDFFANRSIGELLVHKQRIKSYISDSLLIFRQLDSSHISNLNFIALLAETCEKLNLYMEFKLLYQILQNNNYSIGKRLECSLLYINVQRFDDYYISYEKLLENLKVAFFEEGDSIELVTTAFVKYYLSALYNFGEFHGIKVIHLKNYMLDNCSMYEYEFLDLSLIVSLFDINEEQHYETCNLVIEALNSYILATNMSICSQTTVQIENSEYSQQIRLLEKPNFEKIRQISIDYIKSIGNPDSLHQRLRRGTVIIDDMNLLYQYIASYSAMHKKKLYSSFDMVIKKLDNKTINVTDWGCGQALATTLLIDYISEKKLSIQIQNIILIEPSQIALSRGLLHIDVLQDKKSNIKSIVNEIDCVKKGDLMFNNQHITLHLFSNILDLESFQINSRFLKIISDSQQGLNYFICISPNINDKKNARIDIFYKYFQDSFATKLISSRNTDIGQFKRYEKIFSVIF